jgi:hypothetical protein
VRATLTGTQVAAMDHDAVVAAVPATTVFARVAPELWRALPLGDRLHPPVHGLLRADQLAV